MKATIEISLYPLNNEYIRHVLEFLDQLQKYPDIEVQTSGMSTLIFGEYDQLFDLMKEEIRLVLDQIDAIAVLKVGKGHLTYDKN